MIIVSASRMIKRSIKEMTSLGEREAVGSRPQVLLNLLGRYGVRTLHRGVPRKRNNAFNRQLNSPKVYK